MLPPPPIDAKIPDGDLDAPLDDTDWVEDADLLATGLWDEKDDDEKGLEPFGDEA